MSSNVPVARTKVLITNKRKLFNFVYFKPQYSFLLDKPTKLFETTHPGWVPLFHFGNNSLSVAKVHLQQLQKDMKNQVCY